MSIPVGVTLSQATGKLQPGELLEVARRIEALGFESAWLLDAWGREPFVTAGFLLSNTKSLKVGTGIANLYGRDAMTSLQVRQTLSGFYPNRFMMGIGVSNPKNAEVRYSDWMPPIKKITSYLDQIDSIEPLLTIAEPPVMAPLYLAAHGEKLQEIAAKRTDGAITWLMPAENIRRCREQIGLNADITAHFPCVLESDPEVARSIARKFISFYVQNDNYQKAFLSLGFDPSDFADGGSDSLIDSFTAWGTGDDIASMIKRYEDAGATRVVLIPVTGRGSVENPAYGESETTPDFEALPTIAAALYR